MSFTHFYEVKNITIDVHWYKVLNYQIHFVNN